VLRSATRRLLSPGIVFLLALVAAAQQSRSVSFGASELRRKPGPNILVIVVDDVGWRDIDASVSTPKLDRLADEGVTYRRASSTPLCSPTRLALLFGLHGFREDLGQFISACDPDDVSIPLSRTALPRVLRKLGYRTMAAGKWHLNSPALGPLFEAPRLFGFETWRAGSAGNLVKVGDYFDWVRIDDGILSSTTEYNTTAVRRAAT
jgi:arylsulfatase A-like enzyme